MYEQTTNGFGPLRQVLANAINGDGSPLSSLTVLSPQKDPYRLDSPDNHRNGQWFAEIVNRFVPGNGTVHLRGLHYRLVAAADVIRPDNRKGYTNTDEDWEWLIDRASKAGRWLGYVEFARIVDERNAAPEFFIEEPDTEEHADLTRGSRVEVPSLEIVLPHVWCSGFYPPQPYKIVFIGEKTSLREVLRPIAEMVSGELLLPTGEASDTMIAEMAARAAGREQPTVVLYFSDFDPSGRQMPVSVSRKLQALRDLKFPDLQIAVHPVALNVEQAIRLDLPSTPLKPTERRKARWLERFGREQTEIDALAALNPEELERIAMEAIKPFYDNTLRRRGNIASRQWHTDADAILADHPEYQGVVERITDLFNRLSAGVEEIHEAQDLAIDAFRGIRAQLPEIEPPEPEIEVEAPDPLFTTDDDFTTASRRLIAHKALEET